MTRAAFSLSCVSSGRSNGRHPEQRASVVGVIQRGGPLYAVPFPDLTKRNVEKLITAVVKPGSTIYTDESALYEDLHLKYQVLRHGGKEFVRGDVSTNWIDSFWALFRRGYRGTHHYVSEKHLHRYLNEFAGRLNSREFDDLTRMMMVVQAWDGRRLPYKELTRQRPV